MRASSMRVSIYSSRDALAAWLVFEAFGFFDIPLQLSVITCFSAEPSLLSVQFKLMCPPNVSKADQLANHLQSLFSI